MAAQNLCAARRSAELRSACAFHAHDAGERHGQVVAEGHVPIAVVLEAVEQLVALIAVFAEQHLGELERGGLEGAEAEGLAVIDDPRSIIRCSNKVFLAEAFRRRKVPTPKTVIAGRKDVDGLEAALAGEGENKAAETAASAFTFAGGPRYLLPLLPLLAGWGEDLEVIHEVEVA